MQSFCNGKGHIDDIYLIVTAMAYGSEIIKNAHFGIIFSAAVFIECNALPIFFSMSYLRNIPRHIHLHIISYCLYFIEYTE